jgi:hypothetical protein
LAIGGGNKGRRDNGNTQGITMRLRYRVNQGECFRAGVDCDQPIQIEEVNPSKLTQEVRNLIADRLHGIDVIKLRAFVGGGEATVGGFPINDEEFELIEARLPGFEHLIEACRQNAKDVEEALRRVSKVSAARINVAKAGELAPLAY